MDEELTKLRFGANKSLRYHGKRRAFFDALHKATITCSFIGSLSAIGVLIGDKTTFAMIFAAIIAVATAIDFVIGFSARARVYDGLYRRWSDLLAATIKEGDPSEQQVREWMAERILIEKEEPTHLIVLNILCHNDQAKAEGYGDDFIYQVRSWQRVFMHLFSLPPSDFRTLSELREQNA